MARWLYVLSREETGRSDDIFASVKEDMTSATVALTFDRRRAERRCRVESVDRDRRGSDRRHQGVDEDLDRNGWARVKID